MMSSSSYIVPEQVCQRFTFSEIQLATQNFDEKLVIGRGGFGKVYKCPLTIGSVVSEVAIKRLDSTADQGATEFEAEVKVLSKLRHGNLVSLIGYCNEGKEMVLAYEFMPNGTIRDHLRKADCDLSWLQRLKICIGAARALDYLHTGTATQQGIIHRDVKTSNILLDANFAAKISDFGLAKIGPINQTRTDVSTRVKGTFGYMDPCYFFSGKLTRKSDVYAFGVVLFELLSGKQAVDSTLDEDQWSLAAWVQYQIREGKLNKIIDSRLIGQISKKCLKEFAGIAGQCLHPQPKQRPTMAEVVVRLESILSHERELANSVIDERKFINKVRFFFTGKAVLTQPASAVANEYFFTGKTDLTQPASAVESEYFFTGKTDLMQPALAVGSEYLFTGKAKLTQPASAIGSESEVDAQHIKKDNGILRIFTYAELLSATNNFRDQEHSSSLGDLIFKGWVDERTYTPTKYGVGLEMYVRKKYLNKSDQLDLTAEDFNHPNLVKLLGYCLNRNELYCVYELLPDASLHKLLFGGRSSGGSSDSTEERGRGRTSVSWDARLKIALGAAQGLSFLHRRNHPAYSQFKTTHILVDADFNSQLWDFEVENSYDFSNIGLDNVRMDSSFVAPEVLAYQFDKMDGLNVEPSYYGIGLKSEIYHFGVVLLEILTGMEAFDEYRQGKKDLVKWVAPILRAHEVKLGKIVDPQLLHDNCPPKGSHKLANLIFKCLKRNQETRPSMENILEDLYECCHENEMSI